MKRRTANALGSLGLGKTPSVAALLKDLSSEQVAVRNYARRLLVAMGREAIPALADTLVHISVYARGQAATAMGEIGDPTAAPALVKALEDDQVSVRLMAAEALIKLGKPALPALLNALMVRATSYRLRRGAQIVLHAEAHESWGGQIQPVLDALDSPAPEPILSTAARRILETLAASKHTR
jgi:HEAT repeat protein